MCQLIFLRGTRSRDAARLTGVRTLLSWAAAALALPGCSKAPEPAAPTAAHEHVHVAPHGGTLIELGEHRFSLELVRDSSRGVLTAYVLDGHAENFVRIPAPAIEATIRTGDQTRPLVLRAVANAATGETVGDTSQFEAQDDALKAPGTISGTIGSLLVRGATFRDVAFAVKE